MFVYRVLAIAFLQLYFVKEISGLIGVTLAVFSGVSDPHWVIQPTNEIIKLYGAASKQNLLLEVDDMPSRLGYKGLIVQEESNEFLVLGPKTVQLQTQLFLSMPANLVPDKVYNRVLKTIKEGSVQPVEAQQRRKRYAPPFNAGPWTGQHEKKNNCYNYANQKLTDTFAQPGRGSNAMYAAITKERIRLASLSDGLQNAANGNTPGGERHVVALVVEDCVDFHWYVKDSDGKWSHKPGKTAVTRRDNQGALINNPQNCDMNGYEFVCYMTTHRRNVNIR